MAVTAPKKVKPEPPPDRLLEWVEVVAVSRRWLKEHPELPRTWSQLLRACAENETGEVEFKRVLAGDLTCTGAWSSISKAAPKNIAWFRKGPEDKAFLYQQGWRAVDPE